MKKTKLPLKLQGRKRPFRPTTVEEVAGCFKYTGRPKTLQEMDEAITKGVKERHARGRY